MGRISMSEATRVWGGGRGGHDNCSNETLVVNREKTTTVLTWYNVGVLWYVAQLGVLNHLSSDRRKYMKTPSLPLFCSAVDDCMGKKLS